MSLAWLSVPEWQELLRDEGYAIDAVYGWFDRAPWRGGEDSIWVCRHEPKARIWFGCAESDSDLSEPRCARTPNLIARSATRFERFSLVAVSTRRARSSRSCRRT